MLHYQALKKKSGQTTQGAHNSNHNKVEERLDKEEHQAAGQVRAVSLSLRVGCMSLPETETMDEEGRKTRTTGARNQITKRLPANLKGQLPSPEEIIRLLENL